MNNPVWMMSSALPQWSLGQLITGATRMGMQGLELCVFRSDGTRSDHVATHLPYEDFNSKQAKGIVETFQNNGLRFSIRAFENLIGGDEGEGLKNQNHLLKLILMAALMGGKQNGVTVGTFVGYNHQWDAEAGASEKNLNEYKRVFDPIIRYAEDLDVTVVYENCPMEGWREAGYSNTMNNLPATLAARKLMYALIPSRAHGETYDPSHDIWQFVDPVEVLKHSDMPRIKAVHLKATRIRRDAGSIHWGNVYGKQQVSAVLAQAAGVPVPAHEWDRFSYEPTTALTNEEIEKLFEIMRGLKAEGISCIYISTKCWSCLPCATATQSCGTASLWPPATLPTSTSNRPLRCWWAAL